MICLATQYPPIEVSTKPTEYPVSLADAKAYCDYDGDDRDQQFMAWIAAATAKVEHDSETALCTQTCKLYLPWFLDEMDLDFPPVSSVSSITYLDGNGASQTLASTVYTLNTKRWPPRVRRTYGQTWPTTYTGTDLVVTITFVAGYGDQLAVPELHKEAVRVCVKRMYDGCSETSDMVYDGLLDAIRWRPIV